MWLPIHARVVPHVFSCAFWCVSTPSNGSPIRDEGVAKLEYIRGGMRCNIRYLAADVKRPVAAMIAIVDEGDVVVFGPHDHYAENMNTSH